MKYAAFSFLLCSLAVLYFALQWQEGQASKNSELFPELNLPLYTAPEEAASVRIINLFASWCTPCIAELPYLQQLSEQTGQPIIGIAVNDAPEKLTPWLEKHGNPYAAIYLDEKSAIFGAIGAAGLPETFVIDKNRRVLLHHRGPITAQELPILQRSLAE